MTDLVPLILKPQADRRLKKGHLWIYSNEVETEKTPLKSFAPGDLVEVINAKGASLGSAFVNPNALICGRMLSRQAKTIGKAFFEQRLKSALQLREQCFAEPYYRLVYGDGDLLPGLVIDRYDQHLVMQVSVAGMERFIEPLVQACYSVLQPKGIVIRNDHGARELENLEAEVRVEGAVPEMLQVLENQTRFEVSSKQGQKTGWFYDHRVNRAFLQRLVAGKTVLDVFSYAGGWGIQAAQAGAQQVHCVDSSAVAVEAVLHNARLNGKESVVSAQRAKALDALKGLVEERARFDVVILDPPAFIKKRKDQKAGEAAYRHINDLAVRLLNDGGVLVSASCSMPLESATLREIVRGASRHNDRHAQLIYSGSQGPDHPIHPAIPETEYLKAQFYRVLRSV